MRALTIFSLLGLLCWSPALRAEQQVVVAPFGGLGISDREASKVQRWLRAAIGVLPDVRLLSSTRLTRFLRKQSIDCPMKASCIASVAAKVGAQRVVAGDVGRIGGGYVVYLRLIEVARAKQLRALSGVLEPARQLRSTARSLAFRLLLPARFTGQLALAVDVKGAWIYLNGERVARSPSAPLAIREGTHALRVTHPDYHDFVRFVRVGFEQETRVPVELSAFPVHARKMKLAGPRVLKHNELPWYRRWYTIAGFGVAVAATTAVVIALLPRSVSADHEAIVR